MSKEIVPAGESFGDWIDGVDLPELAEEAGELAEVMPYAKYVVGAYRWFRGFSVPCQSL